jgi:hypothetical protein
MPCTFLSSIFHFVFFNNNTLLNSWPAAQETERRRLALERMYTTVLLQLPEMPEATDLGIKNKVKKV